MTRNSRLADDGSLVAAEPAHAVGLARGGPEQPDPQPLRLPEPAEVLGQQQPGDVADIGGVVRTQPLGPGDGPDDPAVPVDELVPGGLVAQVGPRNQLGCRCRGVVAGCRGPGRKLCNLPWCTSR